VTRDAGRKPRVLFVTGEYPPAPGGIADYTHQLRLALAGIGVPSRVVTRGASLDADVATVPGWGWRTLRRLKRLARSSGADAVHVQYQAGAFDLHPAINAAPLLLARAGLPVVVTFHDLRPPYLFPRAGRLRTLAVLRMARSAGAVVVTNPADERALARHSIAAARIPIGPSLPPPTPTQVAPCTVAYFGFASRTKGILDLIAALGAIDETVRPELLLVGDPGTPSRTNDVVDAAEVDRTARNAGVTLCRTGYLAPAQASAALAGAAAIVLPFRSGATLRSSTLPAVVQTGRPIVTTAPRRDDDLGKLGRLPQMTLVAPGDTRLLAQAITRALEWTGRAAPLPEEHRWQSIAQRHRELYRRTLDGGR
jgi:glycosyltransferase involved in cell wall biosynthesis